MKLNLRTISNGLFLIFIGVVLLLLNYGFIGWGFFAAFIDYWPVVLIVLGLGLVFNRRIPASLAFLVLGAVMLTASFFAPPSNDFRFLPNWGIFNRGLQEQTKLQVDYPLEKNLEKAKVVINSGGSEINIAEGNSGFVTGNVTSYAGTPQAQFDAQGSEGRLTIDSNWQGRSGRADEFDLKFTKQIPVDLQINAGALKGTLDFSQIKLSRLDINSGASDAKMIFGTTGMKSTVRISSAASKITLVIPKEIGVQLKYNGLPIGAVNINSGATFNQDSNTYTTQNFSTAESSLDIEINGAVTKVDVVAP